MPDKPRRLRVLVSKEVRQELKDLLSETEEVLHIEFSTNPKGCASELLLDANPDKIKEAFLEKRVPIVPPTGVFEEFDPVEERGAVFSYNPKNKLSLIDALIRARENYKFSYDWQTILRQGMALVKKV